VLDYFGLERSIHDLALIQQFLEFAVLLIDVVEHLHAHGYGSLAY